MSFSDPERSYLESAPSDIQLTAWELGKDLSESLQQDFLTALDAGMMALRHFDLDPDVSFVEDVCCLMTNSDHTFSGVSPEQGHQEVPFEGACRLIAHRVID